MGLILDSSVLIKAERQGQNARQMLTAISRTAGETEVVLSVVTGDGQIGVKLLCCNKICECRDSRLAFSKEFP
jgi:hypothetical protein